MKKKTLLIKFIIWIFFFTYIFWGAIVIAERLNIFDYNSPIGMLLYICGTWSPTILAYFYLKKIKSISTIKDFIKIVFSFKAKIFNYLIIFIFLAALYIPICIFYNTNTDVNWYIWILVFPMMIIDGGMEEISWRYILQPTFEKKFPFIISTIFTSIIWAIWHLPMFFISGSGQSQMSFILFVAFIFSQSLALATIFKISKNVWLCIMYHALVNTLAIYWSVAQDTKSTFISLIMIVIISIAVINISKKREILKNEKLA